MLCAFSGEDAWCNTQAKELTFTISLLASAWTQTFLVATSDQFFNMIWPPVCHPSVWSFNWLAGAPDLCVVNCSCANCETAGTDSLSLHPHPTEVIHSCLCVFGQWAFNFQRHSCIIYNREGDSCSSRLACKGAVRCSWESQEAGGQILDHSEICCSFSLFQRDLTRSMNAL